MTENPATLRWVLPLDDPGATLPVVGGKGASLSRLAAAGLPVPPGFHITTDAYRHLVTTNGLDGAIADALARGDPEQAAATIQPLVVEAVVPAALRAAVLDAYAGLGTGVPVAVRSSATVEDLPQASFAGQQDSFLNRAGADPVMEAVRACWASLWSARAIDYRTRVGIGHDDVALAVVVQELVPADAAGVLFTANPATGARDEIVVNAAWGLGESVVGGQVTPDTVVVSRPHRRIVERRIAEKSVMTVRTGQGTREDAVPAGRRSIPAVTDSQVLALAALGEAIEGLQGGPTDVEWAIRDGSCLVLQARPITHLREPDTETWNDSLAGDFLWTCGNLGEAIPSVMTPATWSLVQIFMSEVMSLPGLGGYRLAGNIGGRFYLNLSLVTSVTSALGVGRLARPGIEQAFGRLPDDLAVPPLPLGRGAVLREAVRSAVPFLARVVRYQRHLPARLAEAERRAEALHAETAATGDATGLRALWGSGVERLLRDTSRMLAAGARSGGAGLVRVRPRLQRLLGPGHDADVAALMTGVNAGGGGLASLGPLLGLAALRRGDVDRETYVRRWGHRGPDEFEISVPRPVEDPGWLDAALAAPLPGERDPEELLRRQAESRDAAWRRLVARHPRRAAGVRRALDRAADAARARERARSELIRAFGVLRAFVRRAGEITGHGDDLFYLTIEEILAVLGGDTTPLRVVGLRRRTVEHYRELGPYPVLIRGSFSPQRWAADPDRRRDRYDAEAAPGAAGRAGPDDRTIVGFAGAAGVVEAPARVLTSVEDGDALLPGEILVTTVTNIGWTPLFPRAAAVVTDVGAPLSHAAIVARELGIPAVLGCGRATARIATGDRVRVDGAAGTVTLPATRARIPW